MPLGAKKVDFWKSPAPMPSEEFSSAYVEEWTVGEALDLLHIILVPSHLALLGKAWSLFCKKTNYM